MRSRGFAAAFMLACISAFSCAAPVATESAAGSSADSAKTPARDWSKHPAVVQLDGGRDLYAVSDVHGELEAFTSVLAANHLATPSGEWTGGRATLVIAGDLIDKGPESLEVIDYVRGLADNAAAAGGRVVVTMGNHEAEFLADPKNDKATSKGQDAEGIDRELDAKGIEPRSLVKGTDDAGRGQWLSRLPLGVRVGKWFFCHAGATGEQSLGDLEKELEHAIDKNGYADKTVTGGGSLLEAESWYGDPKGDKAGRKEVEALGVEHIVFGHDPGAFGEQGKIRASRNGVLVKIDTAMGLHEGGSRNPAFMLHIDLGTESAEVLDDHGNAEPLKPL
jgi:diadenosine tetraphosphatase ApaH/serine/threonine PP2A family protein phosphatase